MRRILNPLIHAPALEAGHLGRLRGLLGKEMRGRVVDLAGPAGDASRGSAR